MKKTMPIIAILVLAALSTAAQKQQLTSKMLYHNGPVLTANQEFYVIYYGCWTSNCPTDPKAAEILTDFLVYLPNTPYAQINATYTDASGQPAASAFIFGGSVVDASYSHGVDLTKADLAGIISDQVNSFRLPQDSNGIYIIIGSPDIASTETGFCSTSTPPFHGRGVVNGSFVNFIFLGDPNRCPSVAGP